MSEQILAFDMSNGNEVELAGLSPVSLEIVGIEGNSTELSLRLPMPLYGKDTIDFDVERIEDNRFAFKNVSAESMALLNALFLTAAPQESCGGDCGCGK